MKAQNQFELASSNLFKKILLIAGIGLTLVFLPLAINPNLEDIVINGLFLLFIIIAWLLFKFVSKTFAYHFFPFAISGIYLLSSIVFESRFIVIILMYPTALVYYFIFFRKKSTLLFYLFFIIINHLVVVYFIEKNIGNPMTSQFLISELVNGIACILAIFFMCYFYLRQMREIQMKADKAYIELEKNQAYINIQKNELERKNIELTSYIESNLQLENFAHLASHELKTPVRNVLNFTKLLERSLGEKLTNKEEEYFDYIADYTNKMNDLIVDLYKLSSVSKTKIETSQINVADLIDELSSDFDMVIKEKNAVVTYDNKVVYIAGQQNLIKQVFANIIGNALKFTRENVAPKINITSEDSVYDWTIRISDNGIGINPKYKEKIFLIFKRLHADSSYEGTGIGLSICKKIVELHKGEISVHTNAQGGSTFEIVIPKNLSKTTASQ